MREQILDRIASLQSRKHSFDDFELWFVQHCGCMFGEPPDVLRLCLDIEHALANFRLDHHSIDELCADIRIAADSPTPSPSATSSQTPAHPPGAPQSADPA